MPTYPDSPLEAIGSDGAFEIGGGSYDYGQGYNETVIRKMYTPVVPTPLNAIGLLTQQLSKMPLEALQFFKDIIPDWVEGAFDTVAGAVGAIVGALTDTVSFVTHAAFSVLSGAVGALSSAFQQVLDILGGLVVVPINGAIQLVKDVWAGLNSGLSAVSNLVQSVINTIWSALRGLPFIGGFVPDPPALAAAIQEQQATQQNFTISALATTNRNPTWVCRYPVADVTFPEVMNKLLQVSGVTGAASAGTAHTHPINYLNSFSTTGTSDVLQNTSVGGYITASNTTVFDTVAIQAQRGAGTALNNVFLEVLREDSLGGLTTVSSRDISASLTTTLSYLEFPLPAPIIVQSGEKYVVRLRNASTVATALGVIAIIEDVTSVRASFFTSTAALSSKTSYTAAEATAARNAGGLLPFALLAAKNIAEPDVSYSDDFNRANLGPWWFPSGAGTAVIAGEKLTYGGTTSGDEDALYIRRTSGDASLSSANIYVDAGATTQRLGLLHHANRDLTQFVYLSVTPTNARIYSFTGGTLTQRASVAGGGTGQYSIYYDEVADKYVALKDGNPIPGLQWTSVGSTIKHGPDYRFGGLRISRASSINAGTIDNWLMRDFRP